MTSQKNIDEATAYGYNGVELFHEDFEYLANPFDTGFTEENQLKVARQIRQ